MRCFGKKFEILPGGVLYFPGQDRQRDTDCLRSVPAFCLVPELYRKTCSALVSNIDDHQNHLTTGFAEALPVPCAVGQRLPRDRVCPFHAGGYALLAL